MVRIDRRVDFDGDGCSWRFETRPGDRGAYDPDDYHAWRAEIGQGNPPNTNSFEVRQFQDGDDIYYGFAYRFGTDFPEPRWAVLAQWWDTHLNGKAPLGALHYEAGSDTVGLDWVAGPDGGEALDVSVHPLDRSGTWHRYVVHVNHSPTDGYVEGWHGAEGEEMERFLDPTPAYTAKADSGQGHFRTGIYRADEPTTAIAWGDAYRAAPSYGRALPGGTGREQPPASLETALALPNADRTVGWNRQDDTIARWQHLDELEVTDPHSDFLSTYATDDVYAAELGNVDKDGRTIRRVEFNVHALPDIEFTAVLATTGGLELATLTPDYETQWYHAVYEGDLTQQELDDLYVEVRGAQGDGTYVHAVHAEVVFGVGAGSG